MEMMTTNEFKTELESSFLPSVNLSMNLQVKNKTKLEPTKLKMIINDTPFESSKKMLEEQKEE